MPRTLLSNAQRILLEPLRKGYPVPMERLIVILYGHRRDGGPDDANNAIRALMRQLRMRLAPHGVSILTVGSPAPGYPSDGYMVDPDHEQRLEEVLSRSLAYAIERAREQSFTRRSPEAPTPLS